MRAVFVMALLALAGCGKSHSAVTPIKPNENVRVGGSTELRLHPGDGAVETRLLYPPDRVWRALPVVFDSLGIPIETLDSDQRLLGNTGFKVVKRLGTVSLSKYLDCGQTQGFPSAETYEIQLAVTTQVRASEGGTSTVATLVQASGRPLMFKGDYIRCSSKGEIESRVVALIKTRLQG